MKKGACPGLIKLPFPDICLVCYQVHSIIQGRVFLLRLLRREDKYYKSDDQTMRLGPCRESSMEENRNLSSAFVLRPQGGQLLNL